MIKREQDDAARLLARDPHTTGFVCVRCGDDVAWSAAAKEQTHPRGGLRGLCRWCADGWVRPVLAAALE
ncbi:MAG: hypothetical protein ABII82_05925, partial [Verrucomicrobiota bacterium]